MRLFELLKNKLDMPAPWTYYHLLNLNEREYPKYLKKIYKIRTGKNLNLKSPKTFSEKIQWIKLYGITDLMRKCTDKVAVRDYVKEKIGEEYLKPVLQICNCFDEIDFEKFPNSFVLKCNHGCKWHCIIKDKKQFLSIKQLFEIVRRKMTGWLEQEFWVWEGFEMQYATICTISQCLKPERNEYRIKPKILIEPFLSANRYIEIYCFNGIPKIYLDIQLKDKLKICTYNEDFSYSDLVLKKDDEEFMCKFYADDTLKHAVELSKRLASSFKFVRVDLMVSQNKLYFEELTFTPCSGFTILAKKWNKKLGDWIKI